MSAVRNLNEELLTDGKATAQAVPVTREWTNPKVPSIARPRELERDKTQVKEKPVISAIALLKKLELTVSISAIIALFLACAVAIQSKTNSDIIIRDSQLSIGAVRQEIGQINWQLQQIRSEDAVVQMNMENETLKIDTTTAPRIPMEPKE